MINSRIEVLGHRHCTINANGIVVEGSGRLNGIHYGIIDYNCDNITGTIISKATCDDCGLYCATNQLILECDQGSSLILFGFLIGMAPTVIICGVLRKVLWSLGSLVIDKITLWYDNRMDMRELNRIAKMNDRLEGNTNMRPKFKPYKSIKKSHVEILNEKSGAMSGYIKMEDIQNMKGIKNTYSTSDDGLPCYSGYNKNDATAPNNNIYETMPNDNDTYTKTKQKTPYKPAVIALAAIAACSFTSLPGADCCDNTLYVYSQGKVCDKARCIENGVYQMALHSSSTVCFRDTDANVMTVRKGNSYYREKYMMPI